MPTETRDVDSLKVIDRARKDMGNIMILAASIERVGLLHPVVINTRNELMTTGSRRLAACKRIGWKTIPVTVVQSLDDARAALLAEQDENTCRLKLSPSELLDIGSKLEALEKPKAQQRERAGKKAEPSGNLPEGGKGQTRDKVASALGVSGRTYEKAKQVAAAAEQEPQRFGDLPAKMDAVSVDAAFREMRARKEHPPAQAQELESPAAKLPADAPAVETSFDSEAVLRKEVNTFDRGQFNRSLERLAGALKSAEANLSKVTFGSEGIPSLVALVLKDCRALRRTVDSLKLRRRCVACDGAGCRSCGKCGWVGRSRTSGSVAELTADPVPVPPELNMPEFRAAWTEWKAYRESRQERPYTVRGETLQLRQLASYGPERAVAAIRDSINNNRRGLFPDRVPATPTPTSEIATQTTV